MATDKKTAEPEALPGNGMNFVPTDNSHMDRSFLDADIDDIVEKLTVQEKIKLLAGKDRWSTVDITRLNIPSVKVTDGPNGARGGSFYKMIPAIAIPCGSGLGCTFSPSLMHELGTLLAEETKARKSVCLLGPTINVPRNPLCGRTFEQFSEDPTLSGQLAAAYVNGLQDNGISPTIKHFVGNEQEHERNGADSIIPPRAFREVYLRPFQIAQKLAKPWGYMSSYNKVNGTHCSEDKGLLDTLLKKEWGYGDDGFIMSDWWGTYSIDLAIKAGLSLEMPGGTGVYRQEALVLHQLKSHKLLPSDIDATAKSVLKWVQRTARANADMVYSSDLDEYTRPRTGKDSDLTRRAATESIALLKNADSILPLEKGKVCIIGANAKERVATGGGSAQCRTSWCQSPWDALVEQKPDDIELSYSTGAYISKYLPLLDAAFTRADGARGFDLRHFPILPDGTQAPEPVDVDTHDLSDMFMYDFYHPRLGIHYFTEVHTVLTSPIDGEYDIGFCITGQGWLYIDGELKLQNATAEEQERVPGTTFLGFGTAETITTFKVKKGQQYMIKLLHDTRLPPGSTRGKGPIVRPGIRLGARATVDPDASIEAAVELAKKSDRAVLVVGLNQDWESEGFDRPTLSLPGRSDELISRVAAVNPNTTVVLQTGSAVSMPWLSAVKGVVHAWYLGNECGAAIAEILYGTANPSGRLSLTMPAREEDIPAFPDFKSARTKVHYSEGIWVGYKHYNLRKIQPLFPFGHGLSYTTFEYSDLKVKASESKCRDPEEWKAVVEVEVKNTGEKAGSHSVHVYLSPPAETATSLKHPEHTLQGFDKAYDIKPGESKKVRVELDKYAISHWDDLTGRWRVETGTWTVKIGTDAQTFYGGETFEVGNPMPWIGL